MTGNARSDNMKHLVIILWMECEKRVGINEENCFSYGKENNCSWASDFWLIGLVQSFDGAKSDRESSFFGDFVPKIFWWRT